MTPNILNIRICQGSDFNNLVFQLAHKCMTRCEISPSLVPTIIKIEPMGITLSTGSRLVFGCDDLVLASPMGPNDRTVSVTSIPSSIPNGSILTGPPIDITGWSVRGAIRDKTNMIVANFLGIIYTPLSGQFKLTLPNIITSAMRPNCSWQDYKGIGLETLGQPIESLGNVSPAYLKQFKKLNDAAYKWDLETIDTQGIVIRRVEGLALVTTEVSS